jgi:hypothetical protein
VFHSCCFIKLCTLGDTTRWTWFIHILKIMLKMYYIAFLLESSKLFLKFFKKLRSHWYIKRAVHNFDLQDTAVCLIHFYILILLLVFNCATSRKVTRSTPVGDNGIFHSHNPSVRIMSLGSIHPLIEITTRNIFWEVKAASA